MSKLMWIAGILLVAAGAALGLMKFVSGASVDAISLETAAILLVGGVLSLGVGSVIDRLAGLDEGAVNRASLQAAPPPPAAIPEFGRKSAEAGVAAAGAGVIAASTAAARVEDVSEPTRDTIKAIEQAREKIEQAFEPKRPEAADGTASEATPGAADDAAAATASEEPAPEEEMAAEEPAEGQLYVVEERFIRMRPARILSDGTVEAETEEGWMRFENLEHLDEYLDAVEPARG